MKIYKSTQFALGLILIAVLFSNCRKDEQLYDKSDAKLSFSHEIVAFDTVFSTITTATRQLMVYNPYNKAINISSISLAGGTQSPYSINVDGKAGVRFSNVEIRSKDSLYIFIQVNINPSNQNNPFLITDSIVFNTNGNIQDVDLLAFGQDANFIVADTYRQGLPPYKIVSNAGETAIWDNSKPYVIYGYAVIDSAASLQIQAGSRIYLHKNSGIWVYQGGNIQVNGTKEQPVLFRGDRPEEWYSDAAGQWDRIWINEGSQDNVIKHAVIRNAFIGIQAETLEKPMGNKLILENTEIRNASGIGLFSRNYSIDATNNVIVNCGQYCVALTYGGTYSFIHNTIANFWSGSIRQTPAFYFNNYLVSNNTAIANNLTLTFANSIVYGNNINEFEMDTIPQSNVQYLFDHNILKTAYFFSNNSAFVNCKQNVNPLFKDYANYNFELSTSSPAIDAGNTLYIPFAPNDKNEVPRMGNPDMGAFEFSR
ncbi:MAG: right-handed parallel beta-helix repeat-containing protein [Bacteroidales bacterium]|nr:right-handed parallel beta-helix repeat-containing protein [Bacteroidales bacterium]MDY0216681.1 right-handed parallel beta-helix repeat-containing protein [Bacteroidales bacterium]